ncbi:glycosyltransferase [Demequina subtropica]|uniref:glycosyltransferase n=1 Tax=Demequina subtropica TaxID=1638989 RepID=UPI0014702156|nr:glycosyltransferase [Demequina subtropica]
MLHVTECLGGGVLTALEILLAEQSESGFDVALAYVSRPVTPSLQAIREAVPGVHATCWSRRTSGYSRLWKLAAGIRRAMIQGDFDVIHLHSSIAGAVGRIVALTVNPRARPVVAYSPHGYAFMRRDWTPLRRAAVLRIESALSRVSDVDVLVSGSECQIAKSKVGSKAAVVVQNGLRRSALPRDPRGTRAPGPLRVVGIGRVCYQKAPWLFAQVAAAFPSHDLEFAWVGGGAPADIARWLGGDDGVAVTGWLDRSDAMRRLAEADVVVSLSLWEGMPYALIEAQALGIPCVVSDIPGHTDIVKDGLTGFVVVDVREAASRVAELARDTQLRRRLGLQARVNAASNLTSAEQAAASLAAYRLGSGHAIEAGVH